MKIMNIFKKILTFTNVDKNRENVIRFGKVIKNNRDEHPIKEKIGAVCNIKKIKVEKNPYNIDYKYVINKEKEIKRHNDIYKNIIKSSSKYEITNPPTPEKLIQNGFHLKDYEVVKHFKNFNFSCSPCFNNWAHKAKVDFDGLPDSKVEIWCNPVLKKEELVYYKIFSVFKFIVEFDALMESLTITIDYDNRNKMGWDDSCIHRKVVSVLIPWSRFSIFVKLWSRETPNELKTQERLITDTAKSFMVSKKVAEERLKYVDVKRFRF